MVYRPAREGARILLSLPGEPARREGKTIAISSPERTVADLLRLRSRVGRDLALTVLRRYLQSRDAKPGELLTLARQLRIGTVMAEMLEPLLA